MKNCPKCNRTYDDSQAFCLMDGTSLIEEREVETIARQTAPARKKTLILILIALVLLPVLVLLGFGIAGALYYKYTAQNENTQAKRQSAANVSATPSKPKSTPTPDANITPTIESSPKTDAAKPTPDTEDSEEITPILWTTSASGFKAEDNLTYKFQCPANGTASAIWGSDIYTQDSSICTAAVHAGLFTLESGGTVTIEFRPGRKTYGSTVRNGITSNTFGEYAHSFVVR